MERNTSMVEIPKETALTFFIKPCGLDPLLSQIKEEIDEFVPDLSTYKSRSAISKMANKIARSKTYLDGIGKELVDELKEKPKLVDAERRRVREILDQWKEEVRQPLTQWEEEESQKEQDVKERILAIQKLTILDEEVSPKDIEERIAECSMIVVDESFGEWETEALMAKTKTEAFLRAALNVEKDRRELIRRRADDAANKENKRLLAVAEKAVIDAQKEAERVKVQAANAVLDAEKNAKKKIEEEAKRVERERIATIEREEKTKREVKAQLERQAEEKRLKEKKRLESVRLTKKAKAETLADIESLLFLEGNSAEAVNPAQSIVDAIFDGKVRNVLVRY